jgi:hypothetical protein
MKPTSLDTSTKPMLNTPIEDDTFGQRWLSKVLSRLRKSRINEKKIPTLFNMATVSDQEKKEARFSLPPRKNTYPDRKYS